VAALHYCYLTCPLFTLSAKSICVSRDQQEEIKKGADCVHSVGGRFKRCTQWYLSIRQSLLLLAPATLISTRAHSKTRSEKERFHGFANCNVRVRDQEEQLSGSSSQQRAHDTGQFSMMSITPINEIGFKEHEV
jgi:hypothetical protein